MKSTTFGEIKENLEKFGLSKNQAEIYLLLVAHKELRIQEIVKLSGIPRSSVYENLKSLFDLGIAEEIVHDNYKKIKPYPIGSIRHHLNEKIIKFQTQITDLDALEKSLPTLLNTDTLTSTTVRYYKSVSGARQLLWNTLKATNTVYVYSEYGRSKFVGKKFYMDFVKESRERSIKEIVLINPNNRALYLIKKDAGSSLARTDVKSIRALNEKNIAIKGETFIYDSIYAQVYFNEAEINGFEIESRNFTKTQRSIFETLWKTAKPISKLL